MDASDLYGVERSTLAKIARSTKRGSSEAVFGVVEPAGTRARRFACVAAISAWGITGMGAWKRGPQLTTRKGQAIAARFILAAANRPDRVAASTVGGCAYLVLGIDPGGAPVETLLPDPADLDAGLGRFLGSGGPICAAQEVDVGGTIVAVLTVDPTTGADRPFLAEGAFSNARNKAVIRDGAIYIRRAGSSQEADSTEVSEMLDARTRSVVEAGPPWRLRVEANSVDGLVPVACDQAAVESWLEAERAALTSPGSLDLPTALSFLSDSGSPT